MPTYTEEGIMFAAKTIREGGVVLAPSDTSYAIWVNAFDREAASRIYRIKGRSADVPLPIMIASPQDVHKYALLGDREERFIYDFFPGLVSVVLKKRPFIIGDFITAGKPTVSLMMHEHEVMWKLAWYAGVPLAGSSANYHQKGSPFSFDEAMEQVGQCIDFSIDGGKLPLNKNNTILDLSGEVPKVLRAGAFNPENLKLYFPNLELVTGYQK
jgi:L-threonylcarbamoyladenylate synthase